MRRVIVFKWEKDEKGISKLVEKEEAYFHAFGVDYDEFESGPGNFSTAIVEWSDGKVESVFVNHIRFIDRPNA
jgi:hypothetical protein